MSSRTPFLPLRPPQSLGHYFISFLFFFFFFIKLICWLGDTHKKGGNSAPFVRQWDCHGMGPQLEWRDLHQNGVPIFPRRDHRSQQVDEKEGRWRRRGGTSAEACSSCGLGGYITASGSAPRGLHATYTRVHTLSLLLFFSSRATPLQLKLARRSGGAATHTNHPPRSAFGGGGLNLTVSLLLGSPLSVSLSPLPLVFTLFMVMVLASTLQSTT